jgi:hypothetical protein
MTLNAADRLKDTWTAIFRRKGGDGTHTRLFDNLDLSQRSMLLAEFKLNESERPVIGSLQDSANWFVLTTERLAWSTGGKRQEVATADIRGATGDLKQLQASDHSKLGMRHLKIRTIGEGEYSIEVEPGSPLSGVWNVLSNLGARNRGAIKRAK